METSTLVFGLAMIFLVAAAILLTAGWIMRAKPDSLVAFWYGTVFEFAGFATIVVWRFMY